MDRTHAIAQAMPPTQAPILLSQYTTLAAVPSQAHLHRNPLPLLRPFRHLVGRVDRLLVAHPVQIQQVVRGLLAPMAVALNQPLEAGMAMAMVRVTLPSSQLQVC